MSQDDISASPLNPCPVCNREMQPLQTICTQCRQQLEAEVMGTPVAVAPQPAPAKPSASPAKSQAGKPPVDDLSLPLAPINEPTRPARPASPVVPQNSPANANKAVGPGLAPSNRWHAILVAIGCLVVASVLATIIWSMVTPESNEPNPSSTR